MRNGVRVGECAIRQISFAPAVSPSNALAQGKGEGTYGENAEPENAENAEKEYNFESPTPTPRSGGYDNYARRPMVYDPETDADLDARILFTIKC